MDSDDYLLEDAVEKYWPTLLAHANEPKCATTSFLRMTPDGTTIGDEFDENDPPVRYKDIWEQGIRGDKADAIKVDVLRKIGFPEFSGEKFLAEGAFWLRLPSNYVGVFKNIEGYVCEYFSGGLSDLSLKNRIRCPEGAKYNYELQYAVFSKASLRIRGAINYWRFYFHSDRHSRSAMVPKSVIPLGLFMYVSDRMWRQRKPMLPR